MKETYKSKAEFFKNSLRYTRSKTGLVLAFAFIVLNAVTTFAQNGYTCATAIELSTVTSPVSGTTVGAGNENIPTCNNWGTAPDVYYSISVPLGYKLVIGPSATGYDSIYSLFYGTCDSQTGIACVDTERENTTWENTTGSTQTVYFVMDGWGATNEGTYTLAWTLTPPPICNVARNLNATLTSATLANLNWTAPVTGTALNYEYALTTAATPPASGTITTATEVLNTAVTVNATNYLHVRSNCGTTDGYSTWSTYSFYSGICVPAPLSRDGSGITNVTLGSLNNTTEGETGNYGNFSTQIVNMGQGVTYPVSITLTTNNAYNVKVWVDWNDNLTFDANEEVFTAVTASARTATVTGSLTVPAGALLGNHRMRVGAVATWNTITPCFADYGGSFEDYTINVTAAPSCFIPQGLGVTNTGTGITTISWTAPAQGGTPAGYEYAITATRATPVNGIAATGTQVTGVTVPVNANSYLQVRSNCGNGDYSEWVAFPFYNGVCIPEPVSVNGNGIVNVTMGAINNTTVAEPGNYGNYSNLTATIGQGVTQPFSITLDTYNVYNAKIWVDWNNDLDFNDAGEEMYTGASLQLNTYTFNGTLTVPVNIPVGQYRLRVGATSTYNGPTTPCYTGSNGAYEDYTLNVTAAPTCYAPANVMGQSLSLGSANITWTAPALGTTPAGYEYAVTATATPPASGTASATTTATNVTVTANAVNYLHVRTNCGNGDFSAWTTVSLLNGYCTPSATIQGGNGITNVTSGAINNTTDGSTTYTDYTTLTATIGQGVTQPLSISLFVYDSYSTKVWVDWNDDLDFDDAGEEVFSAASAATTRSTVTGTITVPLTATLGNHRMRVGAVPVTMGNATPCYFLGMGTFEDYTINVVAGPSCYAPTALTAQSTAAGVINVSWTAPVNGGAPAGYEYAVTTTTQAPASGTVTSTTSIANVTVAVNATSYLHVRTNCGNGDFSEWATIPFYNGVCIPAVEYSVNLGITNVNIGSINNTTVAETGQYGNYAAQVVNIGQGVAQTFSLTMNTYSANNIKMWVDWNDDLDFTDAGEEIFSALSGSDNPVTVSGTFTVPATATLGQHRLRIAINPSYNAVPTPCGPMLYGAVEDYTINVTTPPTCFTPTSPAGIATASNTVNLSWTAPSLGNAPAGYEYVVDTVSSASPVSGTAVTVPFVNGYTGIADNTFYYLHVRTNCGNGDFSEWVTSAGFKYIAGETCNLAINLDTQTSPYTNTTVGAANDFIVSCVNTSTAPDLYYSITVPNGYTLTIGQTENDYDSVHSVFYGSCNTANQTLILCADEDLEAATWENLTGTSQTVYYVQDGWGTSAGTFTLAWTLTAPAACDVPRTPGINLTATTSGTASWTVPNTGSPAGYEYAVTALNTPPASGTATTTETSVTVSGFEANANNYLHVRSVCGDDGVSEWVTYAFFSGYCIPESTTSSAHYISQIKTTGAEVNFTSTSTGFSAYTDYTNTYSVTTYPGGSFAIQASGSVTENMYLYNVWVDWNKNFDFSESERVISSTRVLSPAIIGNIAVPVGTPEGTYRMRIRNAFTNTFIPVCGDVTSGEAEDYTIVVGPAPTCYPPFLPIIAASDVTTANLSWSVPLLGSLPAGYEYVFGPSAAIPTGNGTATTERFIFDEPYDPSVSNYLFVRSTCGEGEYSQWASASALDVASPELTVNNVIVYKDNNAINITTGTTLMTGVTIYDIRGSKLYTQSNINATNAAITNLQIQQQVIIVEVTTAKGKVSKRIVF